MRSVLIDQIRKVALQCADARDLALQSRKRAAKFGPSSKERANAMVSAALQNSRALRLDQRVTELKEELVAKYGG